MFQLARWLMRHLGDPKLLLWLTERGLPVHREFADQVDRRLRQLDGLAHAGKTDELNQIRVHAPSAIPGPRMRTLWRLVLVGRAKTSGPVMDLYDWLERFERDGLTPVLRLELRDMLTPRVLLRRPLNWDDALEEPGEAEGLNHRVDWEIVLSAEHVHAVLGEVRESDRWAPVLSGLLDDFSALLRDAMDLARELGSAEDREDLPMWINRQSATMIRTGGSTIGRR